jgi:hypothetical protein
MRRGMRCIAAVILWTAAQFVAAAEHGGGESAESVKVQPPKPRTVAPVQAPNPQIRPTSKSWLYYQEGLRLFSERRLGEALVALKKAVETRDELFLEASRSIEVARKSNEAKKAKDSITALVWLLAERDIIKSVRDDIRKKAGGSLIVELKLLRERSPSGPLYGLIDAILLVAEEGGLSRIGDSLEALAAAAAKLRSYPEAEYRIGQVYLAESETRLAELYMLRAYDMRDALYDESDGIAILESLVDIYRTQGRMKDFELKLIEIAQKSELFARRDEYYRSAMERTLTRQGIDKFMSLYRVTESWPAKTYARLGAFYLDAGRRVSVFYLAAASNALLTRIIETVKSDQPRYTYAGLGDLSTRILSNKELADYADSEGLWADLVLLGEALVSIGERESAREIWTVVASLKGIDPWSTRAAEALKRSPAAKLPYAALSALYR